MEKEYYQISLWKSNPKTQIENKEAIIGGSDLEFQGKATNVTLMENGKGTSTLSFSLPKTFINTKTGEEEDNYLVDLMSTEKRIKLYYENKYRDYLIKNETKTRSEKGVFVDYQCEDFCIDELSRNGYTLAFSTELKNSVDNIDGFMKKILDGSKWQYKGDIHPIEKTNEKCFIIPLNQFKMGGFDCYCLTDDEYLFNEENPLSKHTSAVYGDYIYIPYSQVNFIDGVSDTQNNKVLEPKEQKYLQFLFLENEKTIDITEEGEIIPKNYYFIEVDKLKNELKNNNYIIQQGYLEKYGDKEVNFIKRVVLSDLTTYNKASDSYVKSYLQQSSNMTKFLPLSIAQKNYKICSEKKTTFIIPQLVKNMFANGREINSTSGWTLANNKIGKLIVGQGNKIGIEGAGDEFYLKYEKTGIGDNTLINFGLSNRKIEKGKIYALKIKNGYVGKTINLSNFFVQNCSLNDDGIYEFSGEKLQGIDISLDDREYLLIKSNFNIENPALCVKLQGETHFYSFEFFEAYTRGKDIFPNHLRPDETNYSPLMFKYKYTGRPIFLENALFFVEEERNILLEKDISLGETYIQEQYFVEELSFDDEKIDTFQINDYLDIIGDTSKKYEVNRYFLDMTKCPNYDVNSTIDCKLSNSDCLYQRDGYCPYLLETEKTTEKYRTLNAEKSNRFNLIQELSALFELYPIFKTSHDRRGRIIPDSREISFAKEKLKETFLSFRYGLNLKGIERKSSSNEIITKLYVEKVDNEDAYCSIALAEENPLKDNYLLDFSYYISKELIPKQEIIADLYGKSLQDIGFIDKVGKLNRQIDAISEEVINIRNKSYYELKAITDTKILGIDSYLQEIVKLNEKLKLYETNIESDTYKNFSELKTAAQQKLYNDIELLFTTDGYGKEFKVSVDIGKAFWEKIGNWQEYKQNIIDERDYTRYGIFGQVCDFEVKISNLEQQKYELLNQKKEIEKEFFYKYESFIKEGVWSDTNFTDSNLYYHASQKALKESIYPKLEYSISVNDLSLLDDYKYLKFHVGDIAYVEDKEFFGSFKQKVLVTQIEKNLDNPLERKIMLQNHSTDFENMFEKISATVQNITLNENIYKRAESFNPQTGVNTQIMEKALTNSTILINNENSKVSLKDSGLQVTPQDNQNQRIKVDASGLSVSDDNGNTWKTIITPEASDASHLKIGNLDVSNVRIYDKNYEYFGWDKGGITAYREPVILNGNLVKNGAKDFARFNKKGLSLVENNKIRLRAGYDFNGVNGNINTEKDTIQEDVGFFLYNDKGQPIFKTHTSSLDSNQENLSARLSLVGEMFITNKVANSALDPTIYLWWKYLNQYTITTNLFAPKVNQATEQFIIDFCNLNYPSTSISYIQYWSEHYLEPDRIYSTFVTYQEYSGMTGTTKDMKTVYTFTPLLSTQKVVKAIDDNYCPNAEKLNVQVATYEIIDSETEVLSSIFNIEWYTLSKTARVPFKVNTDLPFISINEITNIQSNNYFSISSQSTQNTTCYDIRTVQDEYTKLDLNLYRIDNKFFLNKEENPYTGDANAPFNVDIATEQNNSAVALYLNNMGDLDGQLNQNSRLFVCGVQKDELVQNLLTILKDGNLHIGGTLIDNEKDQTNIQQLSENIKIENSALQVNVDGFVYLTLDKLKTSNEKMTLEDWIKMNITNKIEQELGTEISDVQANLEKKLMAGTTIFHGHKLIDYNNVKVQRDKNITYNGIEFTGDDKTFLDTFTSQAILGVPLADRLSQTHLKSIGFAVYEMVKKYLSDPTAVNLKLAGKPTTEEGTIVSFGGQNLLEGSYIVDKTTDGNFFSWVTEQKNNSFTYIGHGDAVDFTAPYGASLFAVDNATVTLVNYCTLDDNHNNVNNRDGGGWGNRIEIQFNHPLFGKVMARYAHLAHYQNTGKQPIKVGDVVRKGQYIGQVGSSGASTGSHLHLELRSPSSVSGSTGVLYYQGQGFTTLTYLNPIPYNAVIPQEVPSTSDDLLLVANIVLAEAQVLGDKGMEAVAVVIRNRVLSNKFPNNIYDVLTQPNQFTTIGHLHDYTTWSSILAVEPNIQTIINNVFNNIVTASVQPFNNALFFCSGYNNYLDFLKWSTYIGKQDINGFTHYFFR